MLRNATAFLLVLAAGTHAWAQGTMTPAVVVLRDFDIDNVENMDFDDDAVLLNADGDIVSRIENLGISPGSRTNVQLDVANERVFIVEGERQLVTAFDLSGQSIWQSELDFPGSVILDASSEKLACSVGRSLNDLTMVVLDANNGRAIAHHKISGVAFAQVGSTSTFWAASKMLTAFDLDGNVEIRRPLPRLDPEPAHPTVINARNWCARGIAVQIGDQPFRNRIWVVESSSLDKAGSKNRLFAMDPEGQIRNLVELGDVKPGSLCCLKNPKNSTQSLLVVDSTTGDLLQFNIDGEQMRRLELGLTLIAAGNETGLWAATSTSIMRLDSSTFEVLKKTDFDKPGRTIGMAAR